MKSTLKNNYDDLCLVKIYLAGNLYVKSSLVGKFVGCYIPKCNSSSYTSKKIYIKNSFTYVENDDCSGVRYPIDIKLAGFRSQLEASCGSCHTEEL